MPLRKVQPIAVIMGSPTMAGRLDELDLTASFETKSEYAQSLKKWQLRLLDLQQRLRHSDRALLIAFEGWDASGKGGAIKRLTERLDPRGFKVYPVGAPSEDEKRRHYLWRFWDRVPGHGEMVIFDRSWYGRVLVERVEGLASEEEWRRAYEELNCFERDLTSAGTVTLKFWMHISDEEQLRRFQEREADPFKRWKMSEEDWRNRQKRPEYLVAAEEMFERTDTEACPWRLIAGEHKWHARVEVVKTVVRELSEALGVGVEETG